jgi:hypothetical protein
MASAATNEAFMKAKKAKFVKTSATLGIAHDWSPPIPYPLNNLRSQKAAQSYNE